jgi:hypothetical protein
MAVRDFQIYLDQFECRFGDEANEDRDIGNNRLDSPSQDPPAPPPPHPDSREGRSKPAAKEDERSAPSKKRVQETQKRALAPKQQKKEAALNPRARTPDSGYNSVEVLSPPASPNSEGGATVRQRGRSGARAVSAVQQPEGESYEDVAQGWEELLEGPDMSHYVWLWPLVGWTPTSLLEALSNGQDVSPLTSPIFGQRKYPAVREEPQ